MTDATYIDTETVGMLRERGLSDALMGLEEHTVLVVSYHDGEEYERFTMLDWWAPRDVSSCVLDANKRFIEQGLVDWVRVTVGSSKNESIIYTADSEYGD